MNHEVVWANEETACLKMPGNKRKIWSSGVVGNVTAVNGRLWRVRTVSGKRCYLDRAHDLEELEGRKPDKPAAKLVKRRRWSDPLSWIRGRQKWEETEA